MTELAQPDRVSKLEELRRPWIDDVHPLAQDLEEPSTTPVGEYQPSPSRRRRPRTNPVHAPPVRKRIESHYVHTAT